MPTRLHAVFAAFVCAGACTTPAEVTEVALALRAPPGCELGPAERLTLRVLGDFPPRAERLTANAAAATFDRLPLGTRELAIDGLFASETRASGRALVAAAGSGEPLPVVLLPDAASCPLGDEALVSTEGVAIAPLPSGGMLIAGGTAADGSVVSRAWVLHAGRTLIEELPEGMLIRRRYASASRAGDVIVIAGGTSDASGGAEDTYEVYDALSGTFLRERSARLSAGARMEHGAALLSDGSLLLVGGRNGPGAAPLASVQRIRLDGAAVPQPEALNTARIAPQVLVLDSGAVIVAGGRDGSGALVTTLERFEGAARRFVTLDPPLTQFEEGVAVALPGARIAWLGCDRRGQGACGLELVLLGGEEPVRIHVPLDWPELGLTTLRAVALEDGRILVTGREPDAARTSRAFAIDLDQRSLEPLDASRAPDVLVSLADGTIAELDPVGTSLRRTGSVSAYESPSGNMLDDAYPRVVLDAPDRWERSAEGLRALVAGASGELPRLRFGDFRLGMRLRGAGILQLRAAEVSALSIQLGASSPRCPALRGEVLLERRGPSVRLWSRDDTAPACTLDWPGSGLAAVSFRADADTLLEELWVTRL